MPIPTIDGLDPTLQTIATTIFVVAVMVFSAWSYVTGKKPKSETKEFAMTGQLADMGPVKELISQAGLLFQQQVRTNMALEAHTKKQGQTAIAIQALARQVGRLADIYEGQLKAEETERHIEAEVERRLREKGG